MSSPHRAEKLATERELTIENPATPLAGFYDLQSETFEAEAYRIKNNRSRMRYFIAIGRGLQPIFSRPTLEDPDCR